MSRGSTGRIILYAGLIFLAGLATGVFLAPALRYTHFYPRAPHEMTQHMLSHLQSELQLTDPQLAQIKPLVERTGADLETIHRETMNRVWARLEETHKQIAAFLTPEQKARLNKMGAEHRKRFEHGPHKFSVPPPQDEK